MLHSVGFRLKLVIPTVAKIPKVAKIAKVAKIPKVAKTLS